MKNIEDIKKEAVKKILASKKTVNFSPGDTIKVGVKIIEGMALGKTIISTKIGAEGINYKDGENILIANTIDEFKQVVNMLIKHPQMIQAIGKNAREFVSNYYNNKIMIKV